MNWRQTVVLTMGFLLILAAGVYPPWLQSWDFVAGGEDIWFRIGTGAEGYSWIFRPPGAPGWVTSSLQTPDDKEITGLPEIGDKKITAEGMKALLNSVPRSWRARIDMTRLLIEWLVIASGVFLGVIAFAQKRSLAVSPAAAKGGVLKAG